MGQKFKLKKGDEVIVLAGKDKGKTGKIVKMMPKEMKAIVSELIGVSNFPNFPFAEKIPSSKLHSTESEILIGFCLDKFFCIELNFAILTP